MTTRPIDAETGFQVGDGFARFHQRDDIFNRAHWDDAVHSAKTEAFFASYAMPNARARGGDGFTQKDYALRNAAWHLTEVFAGLKAGDGRREGFLDPFTVLGDGWPEPWRMNDAAEATGHVKRAAHAFGADLVGVCERDTRWVYASAYDRQARAEKPVELPEGLSHVIVVATAMDFDLTRTVPSALAGAATGLGYSRDTLTLVSLAQFIKNLGYQAVPSMNDTALAVPLAVQAGLGEVGRHGLLITPEFGPRVRLGKVFTDLPLVPDARANFGVRAFCDACTKCASACPPKAIPSDERKTGAPNRSSFAAIEKWTTDAEKCFRFWANQNTECSICIRVCPYNRTFARRRDRLWRWLAGTRLRRLALWLDGRRERAQRQPASWWWRRAA